MCSNMRPRKVEFYSMTSSARASREGGIVIPRAFAVLRLNINWNLGGVARAEREVAGDISGEEIAEEVL